MQFLSRLDDYSGDDDASFPRLSRSISDVTGTVCWHAEELARIDYNQKRGYGQDNTDAWSPVFWRFNNWLTHALTNRLPDNWTRDTHTLTVAVPSHICILIQISSPNCFLRSILAHENPGCFPESSARGNLFFFYHDKRTRISLLCFTKIKLSFL